ncbi:MAG: S8 family serine peptidase [Planctomycetota bacterium]|jgi:subtilisin family serine protease
MRVLLALLFTAASVAAQARPVVVLGKKQLLGDAAAFEAFCAKYEDAKRSALRKHAMKSLKLIAKTEQPGILKALGSPDAQSLWLVNAVVVSLDEKGIEAAKALPEVKWVYPAGRVPPSRPAGEVSRVLKWEERRKFKHRDKSVPWNLKVLNVPAAWNAGAFGQGVVVAMFDAGVDYTHQDLCKNLWVNTFEVANNGEDDDRNGLVDDYYGWDFLRMRAEVKPSGIHHGTWTSSVVAGDGSGGKITGVAPRARIMPLIASGGPYNAARAFQYALEKGADVVNMSFSIPDLGDTRGLWRMMAEHATCAGLVLISGAGNFPNEPLPKQIRIPEGIPCVICVGGVTREKQFARFTSRGPVEWKSVRFFEDHPELIKPDVAAFPGPGIALVHPRGEGYLPENNRRRGNSLSAPHVAGVCALMLGANPELTPWKVKQLLEKTARDLSPKGKDPLTGAGLVDAAAAVEAAR